MNELTSIRKILERIVKNLELDKRKGYVCQFCGRKTHDIALSKNHKCPISPHHKHQFVKAKVE